MRSGVRTEYMNTLKSHCFSRAAWTWLVLLAGFLAVSGVRAAESQANRFLLVFETSPAVKKNLPAIEQTLDTLFSSNFQNEMGENDDLAVWTVDDGLHTGTFPLASWAPEDAVMYSDRLKEFLGKQHYTRHASMAALQPLLNRVVKNSDRLTVIVFCDSQSRLLGTPYDAGVNNIITNAATQAKAAPFILVLRAYQGAYLGCSVNRSSPLNFPKFPPPPAPASKPEPPPVTVQPAPIKPAIVVAPVPALIIIGTNATTNVQALVKPEAVHAPAPPPVTPAVTSAPMTIVAEPKPPMVTAPTNLPAPKPEPPPVFIAPPAPAPAPRIEPQRTSAPEPVAVAPIILSNPPAAPVSNIVAEVSGNPPPDAGSRWPMIIAVGSLAVAVALIGWLVKRSRRPRGSLITSSMQDDPNIRRH
jgi:hypothetical protein